MKTVPKHITKLVERMNRKVYEAQELNERLEEWLEKNGADYGFDFTYEFRESTSYSICDTDGFYEAVENLLGGE